MAPGSTLPCRYFLTLLRCTHLSFNPIRTLTFGPLLSKTSNGPSYLGESESCTMLRFSNTLSPSILMQDFPELKRCRAFARFFSMVSCAILVNSSLLHLRARRYSSCEFISYSLRLSHHPSIGESGSRPNVRSCGDSRLVAFFIAFMWKLTSVRSPGHDPLARCRSACRHRIICFTKSICLSAIPSLWGWYGVVRFLLTPACRQNSLNVWPSTFALCRLERSLAFHVPCISRPVQTRPVCFWSLGPQWV